MSIWRIWNICRRLLRVPSSQNVLADIDIPFEPADFDPIDWESFGAMKQEVVGYFVKTDEFGKSEMDYFVEQKMNFGKDEELPIAPAPPVKTVQIQEECECCDWEGMGSYQTEGNNTQTPLNESCQDS